MGISILLYYSAGIGSGISSIQFSGMEIVAPAFDLYGNIRPSPQNSNPDMGAIESNLSFKTTRIHVSKEGSDAIGFANWSFPTVGKGRRCFKWRYCSCRP